MTGEKLVEKQDAIRRPVLDAGKDTLTVCRLRVSLVNDGVNLLVLIEVIEVIERFPSTQLSTALHPPKLSDSLMAPFLDLLLAELLLLTLPLLLFSLQASLNLLPPRELSSRPRDNPWPLV